MTELPIVRTFTDSHGVEITFYEWPVASPRGVVQVAHGLGEHARRYDDFAARLNRAGFSVYADDHRGHGLTGKKMVELGITKRQGLLGPGGMDAVLAEVRTLTELIKAENPNTKLVKIPYSYATWSIEKYKAELWGRNIKDIKICDHMISRSLELGNIDSMKNLLNGHSVNIISPNTEILIPKQLEKKLETEVGFTHHSQGVNFRNRDEFLKSLIKPSI